MTASTPAMDKPLRCLLGLHKYTLRINPESGYRYHACNYCGNMDQRSTRSGGGPFVGM